MAFREVLNSADLGSRVSVWGMAGGGGSGEEADRRRGGGGVGME